MLREVTLNRASDYLEIAVPWIKVVKKYLQQVISRKVAGLPGVQLTIYFL